ncbi:MAG: hypothetical protein CSB13_06595 [Chloroflexi bacterium]|nr:MAG: hypothetical protein CSB13_06595 [Chloroflexota bacterium]
MKGKQHDPDALLYNSVFVMIGLAYDWDIDRLAQFYQVLPAHLELWLRMMGFAQSEIASMRHRSLPSNGRCRYCDIIIPDGQVFCSQECGDKFIDNREQLLRYRASKVVPNSVFKNVEFDVVRRRGIYVES